MKSIISVLETEPPSYFFGLRTELKVSIKPCVNRSSSLLLREYSILLYHSPYSFRLFVHSFFFPHTQQHTFLSGSYNFSIIQSCSLQKYEQSRVQKVLSRGHPLYFSPWILVSVPSSNMLCSSSGNRIHWS